MDIFSLIQKKYSKEFYEQLLKALMGELSKKFPIHVLTRYPDKFLKIPKLQNS